jgi:hypothetical protein
MRTYKLVFAFFVLIFLVSCSDENDKQSKETSVLDEDLSKLTEDEVKVLFRMREPNNRVSIDEVMRLTDEVIGILDSESVFEFGSNRKINSMSALVSSSKPALKPGDVEIPDTLAYVLNFNDSLGFAIISADTRIDNPILAFTKNGSLSNSTDNPGMAIFLERLENYMLNSIVEAEHQKDSLISDIIAKLNLESGTKAAVNDMKLSGLLIIRTESPWATVNNITPLVPVEWGQKLPFSNKLVNKNCTYYSDNYERNLTGCVAVAVAQTMSYWKHPTNINGYSFNWTELNQYTARPSFYDNAGNKYVSNAPPNVKNQLANLFEQIGKGVSMDYGCKGSSSNIDKAVNFLSKQGFKTGGVKGYDSSAIITSLNNKRPLIARGCSEKINHKFLGITIYTSYDGCHQWVIDGYLKQKKTITLQIGNNISASETYADYMHYNWGWNGSSNGYFPSGVFNSNLIPLSSNTKSSVDNNYQYEIKIVPNIYK